LHAIEICASGSGARTPPCAGIVVTGFRARPQHRATDLVGQACIYLFGPVRCAGAGGCCWSGVRGKHRWLTGDCWSRTESLCADNLGWSAVAIIEALLHNVCWVDR